MKRRRRISVMRHWLCLNCLPTWHKQPYYCKPGQTHINSSQCHPYHVYSEEKKGQDGGDYDLGINRRAKTNWYQLTSLFFSVRGVWGVFGCVISPSEKRGTRGFQSCVCSITVFFLPVLALWNFWLSVVYSSSAQPEASTTVPHLLPSWDAYPHVLFFLLIHWVKRTCCLLRSWLTLLFSLHGTSQCI